MIPADEQVAQAFVNRLSARFPSLTVERNKPEPANLLAGERALILEDGDEEPPEFLRVEGLLLHTMRMTVRGFVRPEEGRASIDDPRTLARFFRAEIARELPNGDTLDGILWGRPIRDADPPVTDCLRQDSCDFDHTMVRDGAPVGRFWFDFYVQFATPYADPFTLIRPRGERLEAA